MHCNAVFNICLLSTLFVFVFLCFYKLLCRKTFAVVLNLTDGVQISQ